MIPWRPRNRSDWTICKDCLQKQQKIDRLEEELRRVKDKLRYQERTAKEGPFGSSTPSSKVPLKANSLEAFVKHADETSWRTDGRGGYTWLFCTPRLSLFRFRASRSAKVAHEVLGAKRLPGTLVVDRYAAYNKAPCAIHYCYSHLSRDIEDLQKDDPDRCRRRDTRNPHERAGDSAQTNP